MTKFNINNLRGSIVAIVTPMHADGRIDDDAFRALIEWHIAEKTQAIIVAGTTGESATLSLEENRTLIAQAVQCSRGRIPIIGGVGANATSEALMLTKNAASDGADIGLSVVPYYNRPTQEGLVKHFSAVADASDLPIIVYDVPKRCGTTIEPETVKRLAAHPNIIGIKDATADLSRLQYFRKNLTDDFGLYSGDDGTAAAFVLGGGHGVMSVTANVAPRQMQMMCEAALAGDEKRTQECDAVLQDFHVAQSAESNPIAVKWALAQMGKIGEGIRLPLTPLAKSQHEVVKKSIMHFMQEN